MTYDFKKQEAELDELLEMIKGVKKLIQMRMESPAKEEPKPVESHFDSFPGHFISSEMQEWKKSYRGVQEERQKNRFFVWCERRWQWSIRKIQG